MPYFTGLKCHVCQTPFPPEALFVCDQCFGPLEAAYDRTADPGSDSDDDRTCHLHIVSRCGLRDRIESKVARPTFCL